MNMDLIEIYFKHIHRKPITDKNREHFLMCVRLLFAVDICNTCTTTQNRYYDKLTEWFNSQIAKGMKAPSEKSEVSQPEESPSIAPEEPLSQPKKRNKK